MSEDNREKQLPKEVYVRRRVAALALLVVVVLLLWWIISSLGGNDDGENAAATDNMASSTTPDMTSPNEPPNTKKETESAKESSSSESSSESSSSKKSCSLADLKVTAQPGAQTFGAAQQPNFFAKISNPTDAECVIDADEDQLKFEVFTLQSYQRVWADLDCNSSDVSGDITIPAGESVNYELKAWSKTTSAPEQCDDRQAVQPGSYLLYTHFGDNVSEPATFNLS